MRIDPTQPAASAALNAPGAAAVLPQPAAHGGTARANHEFPGQHPLSALANEPLGQNGGAGLPANAPNPYTYHHVDLEDHSWICSEAFIAETWGPYGLKETPQGTLATTLPSQGACRAISIIIDKPLCEGCNEPIADGCCHNCELVFHRALPGEAA